MPFLKRILPALILLLTYQSFTLAQQIRQGISIDRLQHYESFIDDQIKQDIIPGAVVLVARNGEVVYKKAFGKSNVADGRDMQPEDLFYIQSMTKPIITTAFMMLYEEGHFQLNDPVYHYLPGIQEVQVLYNPEDAEASITNPQDSDITIEQLLTHTAGLSHGLGPTEYDRKLREALFFNIGERVETLLTFPLIGQPGDQWYYSAAPDILSVLIEKFSGMSTDVFLRERIFEPLGMSNTWYNVPGARSTSIVQNHGKSESGSLNVTEFQPHSSDVTVWSGVNGLFSTVDDYFRFSQMLLNGGSYNGQYLLSRKTVEIMTMNHTGDLFPEPGTGFGLGFAVVEDLSATGNLGSEGLYFWSGAYNTHFFIDPKEKIVALFFTQLQPHDGFYHQKLRQMVYQALVE